jgi:energy-coupling factor transport system ATP-binding protein
MSDNHDLVQATNVQYAYPPPRRIEAIRGFTLRVKPGEFLCIVGQNGSGKTTIARLMSGYLRPDKGTIRIDGQDPWRLPAGERAKLVSYVFQNPDHQLFKESVWEEVAFGLRNLRADKGTVEREVERVLRILSLWDKRELHPFRLAKGDRQRLAVACIMVIRPRILIVDEPTTGQDPTKSREVMGLLRDVNVTEKATVITITHSMELVAEFAGRVVVMAGGKVLMDDTPRATFSQVARLREASLAPPQITRLGLRLGLHPLPLSVIEAKEAVLRELGQ